MPTVGLLALQGDFALHGQSLDAIGIAWQLVKKPADLVNIDGLIIPGGESTTLLKLMQPWSWQQALIDFHQQGRALLGTCAGMILLAKTVVPEQLSLGLIDIVVQRNAYGRQVDSFVAPGEVMSSKLDPTPLDMVFIRAPKVIEVGPKVEVLTSHQSTATFVQQGNVLAASFHPELSQDRRVHSYFIAMIGDH